MTVRELMDRLEKLGPNDVVNVYIHIPSHRNDPPRKYQYFDVYAHNSQVKLVATDVRNLIVLPFE
jgi:hypothetical protein